MAFRVLVAGGRRWLDFAHLCRTLDAVLVNRLPDVEIVTAGGPGVPALAACYASSRGLSLQTVTLDDGKHPGDAEQRRAARLVELADAAVVVWEENNPDVWRLVPRLRAKRVPVILLRPVRRGPSEHVQHPHRPPGKLPD